MKRQATDGGHREQSEEQAEDEVKKLKGRVNHRHGKTEQRLPSGLERRRGGTGLQANAGALPRFFRIRPAFREPAQAARPLR